MAYLRWYFAASALAVALAAWLNYAFDPAGVFGTDRVHARRYVEALRASAHGLWWPEGSIAERAVKRELVERAAGADCVVVGSSRVLQVSSARTHRALAGPCPKLVNLGVSGAGIEDHFALAYLALQSGAPRRIVLGIDPWLFAFGKEPRWSYYAEAYHEAEHEVLAGVQFAPDEDAQVARQKLRNLLSLEYTIRSVRRAGAEIERRWSGARPAEAPALDDTVGGEHPVYLPDGSTQYSASYLSRARQRPVPPGGDRYRSDGPFGDPSAIQAYRSLLLWLRRKGVEPVLLMTPYHPNVFAAPDSPNARALRKVEPIVRSMARELGVVVIGSYDPEAAGCPAGEFFDFMHPSAACLERLRPGP